MSGVDLGAARARLIAALPGVYPWGEVADALLPVVQAMVAEGAAKELRAAANALEVAYDPMSVEEWLTATHARADELDLS